MPSLRRKSWCGRGVAGGIGLLSLMSVTACLSSSMVAVSVPNTIADPATVQTASGAVQMATYAVAKLADAVAVRTGQVVLTGLMTDELMRVQGALGGGEDERNDGTIVPPDASVLGTLNGDGNSLLQNVHTARVYARQAREALAAYDVAVPALRARMLGVEGYAILHLADLACSGGVALSTWPLFGGIPTYTRGYTSDELLAQAVVLFDSAITLAGDSARFLYMAQVGKGRALLNLGQFAEAAAVVHGVPISFVYVLESNTLAGNGSNYIGNKPQNVQVRDHEGGNGLVWSTDPRAAVVTTPTLSGAMPVPGKYSVVNGTITATAANQFATTREADGLEARLIEAEAALALNDPNWLTQLNALRSTCIGTVPCAPVPGLTAANLPPTLTDPGTANARLDLVMKERAMWLYLTAHRQGDLRRLARIYQRDPMTLWPVGTYINPGFPPLILPTSTNGLTYINKWVVVPTATGFSGESLNPLYTGCTDLNP